ncbi:MAG: cyanophycin synthetase [Candidatus Latescibacterota bacterium]|nr:cyanophycin synthetase [Candidatus Latescibacterota bacterium]
MDYFRAKRYLDTFPDWETGKPFLGSLENYLPRMCALLKRLDSPQKRFRSIIIGGTNGKGTVSNLIADLLSGAGVSVGLYTSPHLHTERERIRINGNLLTKEVWTESIIKLQNAIQDFDQEELGALSRFEMLTGLAVFTMAEADVEWGVFEVGLGGRFDATNAWDSEVSVLTKIGLDHVGILGETLSEIAAEKICIGRSGTLMFTPSSQTAEVADFLLKKSSDLGIDLQFIDPIEIDDKPSFFCENAALAQSTVQSLGLDLSATDHVGIIEGNTWPGRFEWVSTVPPVLLDGAHNPQAARALAENLRIEGLRWNIVIGTGVGHDVMAILAELAPLSIRFIVTASDHPKAERPENIARGVPDAVPVEIIRDWRDAFSRGIELTNLDDGALCVTGSLHLIARAREFFELSYESDSITEDMALENFDCFKEACRSLDVIVEPCSNDGTLYKIMSKRKPYYFWRNKHPFNDYMSARIAEDKAFQYDLLSEAGLPTPHTKQVFNPLADSRFNRYKNFATTEEIASDLSALFSFPLIIKKSRSSLAQGVYIAKDATDLILQLRRIFEQSAYADNVLVVQEYVLGKEYRAVASQGKILLAYLKEGTVGGNQDINPLHQGDGRAVPLKSGPLFENLSDLATRIFGVIDLGFYAFDVIFTENGPKILELNPNPFCYYYNKSNGRSDFISIYRGLITKYILNG